MKEIQETQGLCYPDPSFRVKALIPLTTGLAVCRELTAVSSTRYPPPEYSRASSPVVDDRTYLKLLSPGKARQQNEAVKRNKSSCNTRLTKDQPARQVSLAHSAQPFANLPLGGTQADLLTRAPLPAEPSQQALLTLSRAQPDHLIQFNPQIPNLVWNNLSIN